MEPEVLGFSDKQLDLIESMADFFHDFVDTSVDDYIQYQIISNECGRELKRKSRKHHETGKAI